MNGKMHGTSKWECKKYICGALEVYPTMTTSATRETQIKIIKALDCLISIQDNHHHFH